MWSLILVIGVVALVNRIIKVYGFDCLHYSQQFDKSLVEIDEKFTLETTVENDKWLPILHLMVHQEFGEKAKPSASGYATYLMPKQRLVRKQELSAVQRGVYKPNYSKLSIGDFIGLKEVNSFHEPEIDIIVLPKRKSLEESVQIYGSINGDVSVKRWILDDPLMPLGIREYTGCEPQKYIHWNSTARLGQLMVKQFDFTQDTSALIVLNCEIKKPTWKAMDMQPVEDAIVLARSLTEFFEESKLSYGFISNDHSRRDSVFQIKPGLGDSHKYEILRHLGELDYTRTYFLENVMDQMLEENRGYQSIFIVTPRVLDSYVEKINRLAKYVPKVVVLSILDENMENIHPNVVKMIGRGVC